MRTLDKKTVKQRGCTACANCKSSGNKHMCAFSMCPYDELDGIKDYDEEFNEPKRGVEYESVR